MRVAGHDEHHHGLALTDEGEITDQPFHAMSAAVEKAFRQSNVVSRPEGEPERPVVVGNIPSAVDIAALWAEAPDPFVIVAESDGAVVCSGGQPSSIRAIDDGKKTSGMTCQSLDQRAVQCFAYGDHPVAGA